MVCELKELCIEKVVDLAVWLASIEQKLLDLSLEVEKLRRAVRDLGSELGLESYD